MMVMPYLIVAALGMLTAYLVFMVFEWDDESEEGSRTVYDAEGNPLYREYEVKVYGRTYSAKRKFEAQTVHDVCPNCGGKVAPYEEDMWMGGHSTSYTMYGCDTCGRTDDDDFGVLGSRVVESSVLEYIGPRPEARECPTKLIMGVFVAMAVLGCGAFVASRLFSLGSFWTIVGIGTLLCGIAGAGCIGKEE